MAKLQLKNLEIKSFVTGLSPQARDLIMGGTCPYVCLTAPDFTLDPNGCLSYPQFICDDPYGVTREHATCL